MSWKQTLLQASFERSAKRTRSKTAQRNKYNPTVPSKAARCLHDNRIGGTRIGSFKDE